jgi:glycosyltransferase involved in cell wall biosynthesis
MLETFKRNPAAGLVGAKLVYPNGVLQEAGGAVYNDASAANLGNGMDPGHPDYTYLREVDYCSGAGIMIPRRLFFDLGGFDRRYSPCYYEDADLAFKVREAGYKVYYQPAAEIGHYEGISCGRDMASGPKQNQERNRLVFFERWAAKLAGQPAPGGDAVPRRGGKRILVVEHHLPQPDRNAGTMRMDRLLRMMAEAGHRVTLMPDDLEGVGGYTESLEQAGVRVPRKPYVNNVETWLRENAARHDIVVLSRLGIARKYLQTIRAAAPAAKIIYDTVDLHFMRDQGEAELRDDDALRERARQTKAEEIFLIEAADCTWVVSAAERETLRREAPSAKVEVVTLPYELHGSATPFAERRDLLFIGGFSHAPNIDAVRFFMTEIWPLIEGRAPGVKLYIIGADPPEEVRAFGAENVIVTGFVPEVRGYFDRVRLSVAPLRFGAGVKGKINQSMSHGVPVVATTVAIEGMQLRPNEEVLVADEPADFAARVAEVYNQEALWSRVSESGLRATQRLYSVEAVRERLLGSL